MALLDRAFKPRGLTLGRPSCSSRPSPGDVVPIVPDLDSANPLSRTMCTDMTHLKVVSSRLTQLKRAKFEKKIDHIHFSNIN
jgi:hypothetical protein